MGRPSFIIIGAERCGTTSLYSNICMHSEILPAYQKEIEYFDRYYENGDDWYHLQFQDGITGEATPTYFWNPAVPARIRRYDRNIKLIFIKRDKNQAIKSKYRQQVAKGVETLSYEQALDCEELRIRGELDRTFNLPYNYYPSLYVEHAYTDRYDYEKHLNNWVGFNFLEIQVR